ncbi:putative ABC-type glycerol 3-phosphate transporter [Dioscorea sansibarensis]
MADLRPSLPLAMRLFQRPRQWSRKTHRRIALYLTFFAYFLYHVSRKPTSIVKSVLNPEDSDHHLQSPHLPCPIGPVFIPRSQEQRRESPGKGWAPFNDKDGNTKLVLIDVAFISCYSFVTFFAGHLCHRYDLRLLLTVSMSVSGALIVLFGMGYSLGIHVFWFFLVVQMLSGLFQATAWPSVVTVVVNWSQEQDKGGLMMGFWSCSTSIGNIMGTCLAVLTLHLGWGWSFIFPGAIMIIGAIPVCCFLIPRPEGIQFPDQDEEAGQNQAARQGEAAGQSQAAQQQQDVVAEQENEANENNMKAIGIYEACNIPGVIQYALCLLCTKFVANTCWAWLPFYLSQTDIGGKRMSVSSAGLLSVCFDGGGALGGILAGYISDRFSAKALTAAGFICLSILALVLYGTCGTYSLTTNILLMIVTGFFVNGPCAFISTAVSADLVTHNALQGNRRALATVTAIIGGTGSIGAALGPLLTGFVLRRGWVYVAIMLGLVALLSLLPLTVQVRNEIRQIIQNWKDPAQMEQQGGDFCFSHTGKFFNLLYEFLLAVILDIINFVFCPFYSSFHLRATHRRGGS